MPRRSPAHRALTLTAVLTAAGPAMACRGNNDAAPIEPAGGSATNPAPTDPNTGADPAGRGPAVEREDGGDTAEAAAVVDPLAQLSAEQRAKFTAGEEDSLFTTDIHYIQSNEIRHDVWFPYIRDRGGAYLGVGSDQNYTLIGIAKPELVFLFDIDERVVDTHRAYAIFIKESESPDALWHRFDPATEAESVALLERSFTDADEAVRKRVVRAYRAGRETIWRHLERVIKRKRDDQPSSWLSDPDAYAHVRKLYQSDRVRLMGGDLTGEKSVRAAAAAAKSLGVAFGVVYLSNAEEYFKYVPSYVANIQALEAKPGAILLRTIYNKNKNKDYVMADSLWHYQVHALTDFQARLSDTRRNPSRNPMLTNAEKDGVFVRHTEVPGLSRVAVERVDP